MEETWEEKTKELEKKAQVMECQWRKNHNQPKVDGAEYDCDNCKDRFLCYMLRAKKFRVSENAVRYSSGIVYAEDRNTANQLYFDYWQNESDIIVRDFDEGEDCEGEVEVVEITEAN